VKSEELRGEDGGSLTQRRDDATGRRGGSVVVGDGGVVELLGWIGGSNQELL